MRVELNAAVFYARFSGIRLERGIEYAFSDLV